MVQVGENVTKFKVGDEVSGSIFDGTYSQFVLLSENAQAHKPANVLHQFAAFDLVSFISSITTISTCQGWNKGVFNFIELTFWDIIIKKDSP